MAIAEGSTTNGSLDTNGQAAASTSSSQNFTVKAGLARMLKGGVIMDVVNAEQARIAEEAGACAVRRQSQTAIDR